MPNRTWMAVVGLLVVALGAGIWYQQSAPDPAPLIEGSAVATEPGAITVHVSGEVVAPGLVEIVASARVADAVAAAGGTTRDADLARVNLAAPIDDGQQIVIPHVAEQTGGGSTADGRVRINTATVGELEQLPGVGPVLAARIASHREENGLFTAVEDLLDVAGIGERKLDGLRDAVALP